MADVSGKHFQRIKKIIESNNAIKRSTSATVKQFQALYQDFIAAISTNYEHLGTVKDVADIFLDEEKMRLLEQFEPLQNVQLAVCGYNSSGKTSFLHDFLGCGKFLPTGTGATTARIVKFSYKPANETYIREVDSFLTMVEQENSRTDLSAYFADYERARKVNVKGLKETVGKYLKRQDKETNPSDFEEWASIFVEICIPSSVLELGIDVYDTPGFLASDNPILCQNLLSLVADMRPSLLFLYENPIVPSDSRSCFDQLKNTLGVHFRTTGIFFLNTKADVDTILDDNDDADDVDITPGENADADVDITPGDNDDDDVNTIPDENDDADAKHLRELLEKTRSNRYKLLLKVDEMNSDLLNEKMNSVKKCDCFDIFTTHSPQHPMAQKMKSNTIVRIVKFTAKHDLQSTRQIIAIILTAIDTFFDFVLITNRRSEKEWDRLKNEALQWGEELFQQSHANIDNILSESKKRLPSKFRECRNDIERRAVANVKMPWYNKAAAAMLVTAPFRAAYHTAKESITDDEPEADIQFVNLLVENQVLKPILNEIVKENSNKIEKSIDQQSPLTYGIKNELRNAAYREIIMHTGNIGSFAYHVTFKNVLVKAFHILMAVLWLPLTVPLTIFMAPYILIRRFIYHRKNQCSCQSYVSNQRKYVERHLAGVEQSLSNMDGRIKKDLNEWLDKEKKIYRNRVNCYHRMVSKTIHHREQAYALARKFASKFASMECRLVANLDLSEHQGTPPVIDEKTIGTGGFFFVHPASWGTQERLVVKSLRDPVAHPDHVYMEAHFHRAVTRLGINHIAPLRYLFEEVNESSKLYILLPFYPTNLHAYLINHMHEISLEKAVQISLNIGRAVLEMHAHELVHRDIKVSNILLDGENQVFLADFGTCQHGTENETIFLSRPYAPELVPKVTTSSDHQFSYEGSALDVFSIGVLMYTVAPKKSFDLPNQITRAHIDALDQTLIPQTYRTLMLRCLDDVPKNRPNAKEVVEQLNTIADQVAMSKPCLKCFENPRYARCLPCRHKTMCMACLNEMRQNDQRPKCILCRGIYTSIEEDTDSDTYKVATVSKK
ncbi:unnamed protein product [Rotaria magnacalcarata]|uniref:Uncharacterized protein n=3 Tax=Rotaria magnacalcarata TaxID=392030 RepID=A0A819I7V8_9BILA|nr:unnamed protein product [Rotaria magnacalcarata]CAF3909345.1 unnamed protein product [Rotaria magnacalcarata]